MVCVFNVTALRGGDCVSVIFMFSLVKCICSSLPSTVSLIQVFALALLVFPNVFFLWHVHRKVQVWVLKFVFNL